MNAILSPKAQLTAPEREMDLLMIGWVIAWPLIALLVFAEEPPFIPGLSWFAIILGAVNTIGATAVNREVTPDQ